MWLVGSMHLYYLWDFPKSANQTPVPTIGSIYFFAHNYFIFLGNVKKTIRMLYLTLKNKSKLWVSIYDSWKHFFLGYVSPFLGFNWPWRNKFRWRTQEELRMTQDPRQRRSRIFELISSNKWNKNLFDEIYSSIQPLCIIARCRET